MNMQINGYTIEPGADLRGANLREANLREANLRGAKLKGANLIGANLGDANLRDAYLGGVKLGGAYLMGADLTRAFLWDAKLKGAKLKGADLTRAYLRGVDLRDANLRDANLTHANLTRANLSGADLSRAKGLLDPAEWLAENFETVPEGYLVFRTAGGGYYDKPWGDDADILTETVNPNRIDVCGCGVNFATSQWCRQEFPFDGIETWLLEWKDLAGVVVPYNTDGKARCARLVRWEDK